MKKRKTQKELVKEHLLKGKRLSQKKAIVYFNAMRLGAVIFELKVDGLDIQTEYRPNEIGGRYAVYYLENSYIHEYFKANQIFGDDDTYDYVVNMVLNKNNLYDGEKN